MCILKQQFPFQTYLATWSSQFGDEMLDGGGGHWRPILIWTHCDRDFRRVQHVGSPAPLWPWQKDFPVFRGSQRDELSPSEMFSAGAAFQRSFTAQQFSGLWLHGLMVIPNTSFFLVLIIIIIQQFIGHCYMTGSDLLQKFSGKTTEVVVSS